MDLLEYQAKELFQQTGIPVLPSQRIDQPRDLKGLKIPYPIVLKSQVYTGGRGKAGGIRFVENTIDAVAAAQTIFHLPIMGQIPKVILAEAKYESDRELYLAVALDHALRRPVLLGSSDGGMDIDRIMRSMQQVLVDQEFSPFYARHLAIKMGLTGELVQPVSQVVEKMYHLFLQKDLELVEINPLAISPHGAVMALDGKITVNDSALGRHPELATLQPLPNSDQNGAEHPAPNLYRLQFTGSIGVMGNGAGLTMATLDMLHQAGGKPGYALNLGTEVSYQAPYYSLAERISYGLKEISRLGEIRTILINVLTHVAPCLEVAQAIAQGVKSSRTSLPPLVVRLAGAEVEPAHTLLTQHGIAWVETLDEAIAKTIALSSSSR